MEASSQADALLRQLTFAEAAVMARDGRLNAAAARLDAAEPLDAQGLHLLARIRAQQGDWLEAERLWREVLALEPGHSEAVAGLDHMRRARRPARWFWPLTAVGAVALSLAMGTEVVRQAIDRQSRAQAAQIQQLNADLAGREMAAARDADARLNALQSGLNAAAAHESTRQEAAARASAARLAAVEARLRHLQQEVRAAATARPQASPRREASQ